MATPVPYSNAVTNPVANSALSMLYMAGMFTRYKSLFPLAQYRKAFLFQIKEKFTKIEYSLKRQG